VFGHAAGGLLVLVWAALVRQQPVGGVRRREARDDAATSVRAFLQRLQRLRARR